jgi:hypothetical protein
MLKPIIDSILNHKNLTCKINTESLRDDLGYIFRSEDTIFYAVLPCEKFVNLVSFTDKNFVDINIDNKEVTSNILLLKYITGIKETVHLIDQKIEVNIWFSEISYNIRFWYPIEDQDVNRFVWQLKLRTIYA